MKKIILVLVAFFAVSLLATAQPHHGKNGDRIKTLRIAYITEELDLKSEQAEQFWPIFNAYEKERMDLRKSFFDKYKDEHPDTDRRTAHSYIQANLDFQEQDLEIKKRYKDKLLKAISPEQLVSLYQAERGFREMLLKELRNRRGGSNNKGRR